MGLHKNMDFVEPTDHDTRTFGTLYIIIPGWASVKFRPDSNMTKQKNLYTNGKTALFSFPLSYTHLPHLILHLFIGEPGDTLDIYISIWEVTPYRNLDNMAYRSNGESAMIINPLWESLEEVDM